MTDGSAAPELPFYLWTQRWARFMGLCGTAAFLGVEVALLVYASDDGFVFTVLCMLVFLVPLRWFVRGIFVHVRATSEGVRVFNALKTYDLRWDEIKVVEAVNQVTGIGSYARIVKTNGDSITLGASTYGIRGDPTSALRIAVPLGKALDRQRARSMAAP